MELEGIITLFLYLHDTGFSKCFECITILIEEEININSLQMNNFNNCSFYLNLMYIYSNHNTTQITPQKSLMNDSIVTSKSSPVEIIRQLNASYKRKYNTLTILLLIIDIIKGIKEPNNDEDDTSGLFSDENICVLLINGTLDILTNLLTSTLFKHQILLCSVANQCGIQFCLFNLPAEFTATEEYKMLKEYNDIYVKNKNSMLCKHIIDRLQLSKSLEMKLRDNTQNCQEIIDKFMIDLQDQHKSESDHISAVNMYIKTDIIECNQILEAFLKTLSKQKLSIIKILRKKLSRH